MSDSELIAKLEEIRTLTLMASKKLLTVDEAAMFLNYAEEYIRKLIKKREFRTYRAKSGRVYIRKSDLEEWMTHSEVLSASQLNEQAIQITERFR